MELQWVFKVFITLHHNIHRGVLLLLLCLSSEPEGPITLHYNAYVDGSKIGTPASIEVDMVIGADGANSRVAKEIDAGEYDYAIAFQERIRIPGGLGWRLRRLLVTVG